METYNDWLAHHGILGMKWGKRNGPPYPLNEEDHSASEKKAGYKKSLNGGSTKKIEKRLSKDAEDLGRAHAYLEDATRDLRKDWDGKSKLLVPTDVKEQYSALLNDYERKTRELIEKYGEDNFISYVERKDGEDYIRTLIRDEKTDLTLEYLIKLLNQN